MIRTVKCLEVDVPDRSLSVDEYETVTKYWAQRAENISRVPKGLLYVPISTFSLGACRTCPGEPLRCRFPAGGDTRY